MVDKLLTCNLCKGQMHLYRGPRYNRKVGGFLIASGAFTTLFWVGSILGVPLFLLGLYMTGAKRQLWVCRDCNTAIERIELKPKQKVIMEKNEQPQ
ncbi:MAG: hypothetical protein JSW40_00630 [Candidatus Omnitrophota bacterium]|nr:MAG: hypothetical protein JSW40_00630 [Candidatus Omnitrophota bacterium]